MRLDRLHIFILLMILLVGGMLRLYKLGAIPVSLTDDEIRIVGSSYFIGTTGADPYGKILPLSINLDGFAQNPVPIYLNAPIITWLGPGMFSARILTACLGLADLLLIFLIGNTLFPGTVIGLAASAILAINVWHLQVSRFTHEGGYALFFYLLGLTLLLKPQKSLVKMLVGCLALLLAFYSYHATKLLLPPLVLVLLVFNWKRTGPAFKGLLISTVLFAFLTLAWLNRTQNATQYGATALFFQDRTGAATQVELERRASPAPNWLKTLYLNKYSYWAGIFVRHFSYAFSPQYLFLDQEGNGIYAVWFRGQFYLLEIPLLFLGWLYLSQKKKPEWLMLNALALVAPLPSALGVGDPSYTMRSILLLPILTIFIGAGIWSLGELIKSSKVKKFIYLTLIVAYFLHLSGYLTQYYYDWWRTGAHYYSYNTKQMITEVTKKVSGDQKVIVAPANDNIFLQWAFYEKRDPKIIQQSLMAHQLTDGNLTMLPSCFKTDQDPRLLLSPNTVYLAQPQCHPKFPPDEILKDLEGNPSWDIYRSLSQ